MHQCPVSTCDHGKPAREPRPLSEFEKNLISDINRLFNPLVVALRNDLTALELRWQAAMMQARTEARGD